jgi:thiamine biosynthesis lipoprotein
MKRLVSFLLLAVLLTGCASASVQPEQKQYTASFLDVFDTVTTIVGRAESEEAFREKTQEVHEILLRYHQLFDIYNAYDGINNQKTVNDNAGIAPVPVDEQIIALLKDCKAYYDLTHGMVNPAMGSVLQLWHVARNDGINDPVHAYLPKDEKLQEAAQHMRFDAVIIDEAASTVWISDPHVHLDVGAVAKGWSVQQVAKNAPSGLLLSVGGNVCATGPKDSDNTPWVVGIEDPNGGGYLHTLNVRTGSLVTSGDYQRYYVVEGKPYHHIIDPDTLMPAQNWSSVTIMCDDSGLADALSTALFLLPQAEGQKILETCGAEAMWVDSTGRCYYSPGFRDSIRT